MRVVCGRTSTNRLGLGHQSAAFHFQTVLVVGSLLIVGCGGPGIETVPVSGVVTLDGQPVPNVLVTFQPVARGAAESSSSPGSNGTTDSEGRYELKTPDGSGAIVGEHIVTLVYKDPNAPKGPQTPEGSKRPTQSKFKTPVFNLPPETRDGTLKFTVPESGTDDAEFAFASNTRNTRK